MQCEHSADSYQVSIPRYRLSNYSHRTYYVASPTVWNSLPDDMRDPKLAAGNFRQSLKTSYFHFTSMFSACEGVDYYWHRTQHN